MYVCMYVCMCVCVSVCLSVCMFVCGVCMCCGSGALECNTLERAHPSIEPGACLEAHDSIVGRAVWRLCAKRRE